MKKYENQLKSAINSVLLPMGFMQADDVYYRWDTGTDIVTVVRCRVEDPSEFCIQLHRKPMGRSGTALPLQPESAGRFWKAGRCACHENLSDDSHFWQTGAC